MNKAILRILSSTKLPAAAGRRLQISSPLANTRFTDFVNNYKQKRKFPRLLSLIDSYRQAVARVLLKMSTNDEKTPSLKIPDAVRGMTEIDRDLFTRTFKLPALKVPVHNIKVSNKLLKQHMFKARNMSPVVELTEDDTCFGTHKLVLLNPDIRNVEDLTTNVTTSLRDTCGVDLSFSMQDITMTYDNWKADEILRAVLPEGVDSVTGYSYVGHIIHLNLREEHEKYKTLIGQVLLDKIPTARTVVNKTNNIDNTYRNFQMELLAGDNEMEVTVKEHGHTFKFDFSKVYWNPRLSTEHHRIAKVIKHGDIVYDVFGGVGPFAVPVAKKGAVVYANDLNPESYRWLKVNIKANKIKSDVKTFNLDGRQFIRDIVKENIVKEWKETQDPTKMHVIMNLPALAIEFLDAFVNLLEDHRELKHLTLEYPLVYCYCFSNAEDKQTDVCNRVETVLGMSIKPEQVKFVRNVAPKKDMMCAHFQLTETVLFGPADDSDQPPLKKLCTQPE